MEEKRIMVDHEAFLIGIKPAICRRMIPQLEKLMPQLGKYPHMIDADGSYLFFQNQELMEKTIWHQWSMWNGVQRNIIGYWG